MMKNKSKRMFSLMILAALILSSTTLLSADATVGDITREYYWVDLTANGNPHDTYELTLTEKVMPTRSAELEGVNGTDDRYPDTNSSVVRTYTRYNGMYGTVASSGSGFIIGPHTIATAAHCVDSYFEGIGRIREAYVYIYDEELGEEVQFAVSQVHVPQLYIDTSSENYDYALLTVSDDLSKYGTFSLGLIRDEVLDNRGITVNISGFPRKIIDENGNITEVNGTQLYTGRGSLMTLHDERFFFTTDATEGDSGGPAYVTTVSQTGTNAPVTTNTVIGIYSGRHEIVVDGDVSDVENVAARITEPVLQFYRNNPNIGY